ncbi:MAG: 3-keto-disaccharide hydrolase [Luteolibacter sp.]
MKTFYFILLAPSLLLAEPGNEAVKPEFKGDEVIQLISGNTLEGWTVPSERWSISDGVITGDTKGEKLTTPEWLYTKQSFSDFIFTAEVRLSGGLSANSGIYFRVKPFTFEWRKTGASYEAPSGYEYDAALDGKHNGSLGDWYARPSLRIFPDPQIMKEAFKKEDWNRMTIRARGNRVEYWLNGNKIMDYVDHDPKRSHEGLIGIQMHDRLVMKVELRNASILPLNLNE